MADAGDFAALPFELRKEIFSYLLIEEKKISVMKFGSMLSSKVARMDNHINPAHRGKIYDHLERRWVKAPYIRTSLLHINKAVSEEAKQILYGCNHFEFQHAGALLGFLKSVGDSAKLLQHITIIGNGILQKFKWDEMDRALARLTQTGSLRTLEISHLAVCGKANKERCHKVNIKELVTHCLPLLQALESRFREADLKTSVFDVVRITLPPCSKSLTGFHAHSRAWYRGRATRQVSVTQRSRGGENQIIVRCNCRCSEAEDKNARFMQELREEIARQLGLEHDE